MTQELLEKMGSLAEAIGEVKTLALPRAEAEDRLKKIETDVESVMTSMKNSSFKDSDKSYMDTGKSGSADWLLKHGYNSIPNKNLSDKKRRKANDPRPINHVSLYKTDGWTQQTTDVLNVPEDVKNTLEMMDEIYIIDKIFEHHHGIEAWNRMKTEHDGGARGLFLERFPEISVGYDAFMKEFLGLQGKALDSTTSGSGDDWVPTLMASNLLDIIRLNTPVVNLLPHVRQPSNPWQNPLLNTIPTCYRKLENTNTTESNLGTANLTWTAHIFGVYSAFSDELNDDSIVAIAPTVRSSIIRSMAEGLEEALINGDGDSGAHFDDDYIYSSGGYRTYQGGMYGIRQFAMDDDSGTPSTVNGVGASGAAISYKDIGAAMAAMGKFAAGQVAQGNVAGLVNAQQYVQLVTETDSPIQTVDKYGSGATLLTGELGRIFGIPLFISYGIEQRKDSVAATGQNTSAGPNTLSTALVFNRMNWRIGDRRDFRLERDKDIIAGRNDMVATARWSLQSVEGDNEGSGWDPSTVPAAVAIVDVD